MRYLSADCVFPVTSGPLKNGVVICGDDGVIAGVLDEESAAGQVPAEKVERYEGLLCPGFVNSHCHLELSHLRGKIPERTGLGAFLCAVTQQRGEEHEARAQVMEEAEAEMIRNGIVAAGDVANGDASFGLKERRRLHYHTFVEVLGLDPAAAPHAFARGQALYDRLQEKGLAASIVPHAPYSVSRELLKLVAGHAYRQGTALSIHNQESEDENRMFINGSGDLPGHLAQLGADTGAWQATGHRSLPSTIVHLPACNKIQLVHNTTTLEDDIARAQRYSKMLYWCLCPGANLYIENRLPDVPLFIRAGLRLTLGTDSLASNRGLSILEEMKAIAGHFPETGFDAMLPWATLHGAELLGLRSELGSLEKNKSPGLNVITGMEPGSLRVTAQWEVKPLTFRA